MSVENINGTPRNHVKALSMSVRPCAYRTVHHTNKRRTHQLEYDRVRTLTVYHTNKKRTHQCKYDRVRTQRYTIQTRRQRMRVENINGTPRNHAKVLSM